VDTKLGNVMEWNVKIVDQLIKLVCYAHK